MELKILVLDGAARQDSESRKLAKIVTDEFLKRGSSVTFFDQSKEKLPLYDADEKIKSQSSVQLLLKSVKEADVLVLSSPEYHNSMSGSMKNALDWLTELKGSRLRGKLVGLIGGGGAFANSGANIQMMMVVRALHGWLMPEILLSVPNVWDAYTETGGLKDKDLNDRLNSFCSKLLQYGKMFKENRAAFS